MEAAKQGVEGARAFYFRLHLAMGVDPKGTVGTFTSITDDPVSVFCQWTFEAATGNSFDILSDLRLLDDQKYLAAKDIISQTLAQAVEQTASFEPTKNAVMTSDDVSLAKNGVKMTATGQLKELERLMTSSPRLI